MINSTKIDKQMINDKPLIDINSSLELLNEIKKAAEELKAEDVIDLDLSNFSAFTDYLIVCHGTSSVHVNGIADKIYLSLKHMGVLPLGVEGKEESEWILMDYDNVVVHIFQEEQRKLYKIESLYESSEIEKD